MLRKLIRYNDALLNHLAAAWHESGYEDCFLADAEGQPLWPPTPVAVERPAPEQILQNDSLPRGWVVVAISAGNGDPSGFLVASTSDEGGGHAGLDAQVALLEQLLAREAELNGMAAELMNAYDQIVAMYHVSEAARSYPEPDDVLRVLIDEAKRLCKATSGFVALERQGEPRCVTCGAGCDASAALAGPLLSAVRERGGALLCNASADLRAALADGGSSAQGLPDALQRCLATPITIGERVVGVLSLLDKRTPFTAGDQKLLVALADEAGSIIERARLRSELLAQERLRRELEIAAEIQMGLLPTELPKVPQLDLAARSQPANEVGGDFYDFLSPLWGPLGFVLGDVTSKGVPAALFVTVVHTIDHAAFAFSPTPRALLERLNTDLYDELSRAAMFVTLFVGYYHPHERRVVCANAGHSPVLHYDARIGQCRLWEADGPPLGVLPDVMSTDRALNLNPGDMLVVMSDGFNEAVNPAGDMLGIEPLMTFLESHAGENASEIQRQLFEMVSDFTQGAPQADDMTICVLRVTPE